LIGRLAVLVFIELDFVERRVGHDDEARVNL